MKRTADRKLIPLYAVMLLLIFHSSSVIFINSSFLDQFVSTSAVGTIYTITSAIGVLLFLFISTVLRRVGNFKLTILLLIIDFVCVILMALSDSLRVVIPAFILYNTALPLIFFNLDVFIEEQIDNNESATGSNRGLLLTLSSLVGALAPIVTSVFIEPGEYTFTYAYLLSAVVLIPVTALLFINFKNFSDPPYGEIDVLDAMQSFWERKNIRLVFLANFMLQFFFVFAVIYMPLYLTADIGLSWTDFGIIIFFSQLAYVIFEYPVGIIADKYIGEKEMMAVGFLIMIISLSWFAFVTTPNLILWSAIMFISRIGASLVEVTTESYFFKKTRSSDAQIISFFRITRPLSYVLGALGASFVLLYVPFNLLFVVSAFTMIPAMFFAMSLEDTK